MYFSNLPKTKYQFGTNSESNVHEVADIFNRKIVNEPIVNYTFMDIYETPDQLANSIYQDSNLFYTNLLLNNISSKNDLPIDQVRFETEVNRYYSGYVFHILEEPDQQLGRGDIVVLKSDLDAGSCTDPDNLNCHISYAVIENWDPILKQIWCKVYKIGSSGASTESKLFANQNKFKIFKRDNFARIDLQGVQIKNESAFDQAVTDNKYTFEAGVFTMKRVSSFSDSIDELYTTNNITLNPQALNIASSSNIEQIAPDYNSNLLNSQCSILDAYILSASREKDSSGAYYKIGTTVRIDSKIVALKNENESKREIAVLNRNAVGNVAESIQRSI